MDILASSFTGLKGQFVMYRWYGKRG